MLGGLTSLGQTYLPAEFHSLANSSSGWTLPTATLVLLLARSFPEAAIGGALSFVSLTIGYSVVSGWRGFEFDPTTWAVIGLAAGPVVGAAAHALRRGSILAAVGTGVLAGILIGEGIYGLTVISATTSPVYWWIAIVLGTSLLIGMLIRLRSGRATLIALGVAIVGAAAFPIAYLLLGEFVVF